MKGPVWYQREQIFLKGLSCLAREVNKHLHTLPPPRQKKKNQRYNMIEFSNLRHYIFIFSVKICITYHRMVWIGWDLKSHRVPALLYGMSCPLLWTQVFSNIVKPRWIFKKFDFYFSLKFLWLEKRHMNPKQGTFYTEDPKTVNQTVKFSEVVHRNLSPLREL